MNLDFRNRENMLFFKNFLFQVAAADLLFIIEQLQDNLRRT